MEAILNEVFTWMISCCVWSGKLSIICWLITRSPQSAATGCDDDLESVRFSEFSSSVVGDFISVRVSTPSASTDLWGTFCCSCHAGITGVVVGKAGNCFLQRTANQQTQHHHHIISCTDKNHKHWNMSSAENINYDSGHCRTELSYNLLLSKLHKTYKIFQILCKAEWASEQFLNNTSAHKRPFQCKSWEINSNVRNSNK